MAIAIAGIERYLKAAPVSIVLFFCVLVLCPFVIADEPRLSIDEFFNAGRYGYLIDSLGATSDSERLIKAKACVAIGDKDRALRELLELQTASLAAAAIYFGYGEYSKAESLAAVCRADSGISAEISDYLMATSAPDTTASNLAIWQRLLGSKMEVFRAKAALEIVRIDIAQSKLDSAQVMLQEINPFILNGNDLIEYRLALAIIYHGLGNYSQAIDQIDVLMGIHHLPSHKEKAADLAIDSLYPRLEPEQSQRLGRILERGRFYKQAIIVFSSLKGSDSTDLDLAWCYFGDRRYREASEIFEQLAESPNADIRGESLYGTAVCAYRQGRRLDAVNKLLAFAEDFPDDRLAAKALFTAGEFYSGSDIRQSIDIFSRLLSAYPESPYRKRARFLLGKSLIQQGLTDKAAQAFAAYSQNDETADLFDFWQFKIAPGDSGSLKRILDRKNPSFYHFQTKKLVGQAVPDSAISYDNFIIDFFDRAEDFLNRNSKSQAATGLLPVAIDSLVHFGLTDEAGRELISLESANGTTAFELATLRKCRSLGLDWVFFSLLEDFKMRLKQLGYSFSQDTWLRLSYPVLFKSKLAYHGDKIDPYLALAILRRESRFEPAAVSNVGAIGLMQLMPPTAAQMAGVDELPEVFLFDPGFNIRLGCKYLRWLSARLNKKEVVIAAYNAGPTAAKKWQKLAGSDVETYIESIGYDQSRDYARWVMGDYLWYKYLWPKEFSP